MGVLSTILLVVEILGLLVLLVSVLAQMRREQRAVTGAMRDGAGAAFVAGLLRIPVRQSADQHVAYWPTVIGLLVILGALVLATTNLPRGRAQRPVPTGLWALFGLLGVVALALLPLA